MHTSGSSKCLFKTLGLEQVFVTMERSWSPKNSWSIVLRRLTHWGSTGPVQFLPVLLLGEDNRRIQVQILSYLRQTNEKLLFDYGTFSIGRPYAEYKASA